MAWSGQQLGFENAPAEHKRSQVPQGSYRYVVIVGFQVETVGPLLEDAGGGTPQRFTWLQATHPLTGTVFPDDTGLLGWKPVQWE